MCFHFGKKSDVGWLRVWAVAKTVRNCISILFFLKEVQCCWVPTCLGNNLHFLALLQIRQSCDILWPLRSKQKSQGKVYRKALYLWTTSMLYGWLGTRTKTGSLMSFQRCPSSLGLLTSGPFISKQKNKLSLGHCVTCSQTQSQLLYTESNNLLKN